MIEILLQNETLQLLAERAIFWKRKCALLIADTHWGKAATMRSAGLPIPGGTTRADMLRLSVLIHRTGAKRIVFLGDVIHARSGRAARTLDAVAEWREGHPDLELSMIRGNHDAHAGDPPRGLKIHCADAPLVEAPFVFQHFPGPSPYGYALAGHTHPAVKVGGRAGERATLPCFHFTPDYGTLPAFGALTGCAIIHPGPEDLIYGIAGDEVVPVNPSRMRPAVPRISPD
jgi:DNA ligase-associated metallophosphoesterase